jgi:hypothetical protein
VKLDPANFTTRIDNRYFPLRPGSRWVYRETSDDGSVQRVVVTVRDRTRRVAGIEARVVHDKVTEKGRLVENTFDWYAQDRRGNVWYLGEDTKEYARGRLVSTAGSWETGVNGAQPGVIMPGTPRVGLTYRQEYLKDEAEDGARVLSIDEQAQVPFGHFRRVLLTSDFNPLMPKDLEHKFYARGVGLVLALGISGDSDREQLIRFRRGR